MQEQEEQDKQILTRQELAKLLSVSHRTIGNWEKAGLPTIKCSHRIRRYSRDAVWDWLMAGRPSAKPTTEGQA